MGENGATGTYDIKASHYSGLVNAGDTLNSDPHTGYKWYRTGSYQTPDTKRRTVIVVDGDVSQELAVYAEDCSLVTGNKTAIAIGKSKQCLQLSTSKAVKYIKVPAQIATYTITTEIGDCADVTDGAVALVSSVALAFALVLVALF